MTQTHLVDAFIYSTTLHFHVAILYVHKPNFKIRCTYKIEATNKFEDYNIS